MNIKFKQNTFQGTKDVLMEKGKQKLNLFYGANGDLYVDLHGNLETNEKGEKKISFEIEKNENVFMFFDELLNNIISCNVFSTSKHELDFCKTKEDRNRLIVANQIMNAELKNSNTYDRIVQNNSVVWLSDETRDEKANKMELTKTKDKITLTIVKNDEDPSFGFGVRICNSGSKSKPFNLCFMNLYQNLQSLTKANQNELKL